jgi:heptosyltransferase-1
MSDILFIKTSSLGDIIHHMPAVVDARRHRPDARLVWIVEELYAPLARLNRSVDEVIAIATRRWRRQPHLLSTWREARDAVRIIRAARYDAVIDTQGLVRSALLAKIVRGRSHGYDRASIREPLASMFYDVRHTVSWNLHVIERNRALTGLALGYDPLGPPEFDFDRSSLVAVPAPPYAVLLHATASTAKEWPEERWTAIGALLAQQGLEVVLPWGTEAERARSERIAAALPRARVPDRRPILDVARLLAGATLVVGVDTGFLHIAAVLGVPVVAVFVLAKSVSAKPIGPGPVALVGGEDAPPDVDAVKAAIEGILIARPGI